MNPRPDPGERLTWVPTERGAVQRQRLVQGLTATFGGMSLVLAVVGILTNPAVLILAAVFGVVAGLMYYQASGRLARRVYRRVERQAAVDGGARAGGARAGRGGFGAGPREEWRGPHRGRASTGRRRRTGARRARANGDGGLAAREAYDALDLEPGADQAAIRDAYRERIKEVHPDTEGGDEAAFRRVRDAYERLSD